MDFGRLWTVAARELRRLIEQCKWLFATKPNPKMLRWARGKA